jgi:hypothetical protein
MPIPLGEPPIARPEHVSSVLGLFYYMLLYDFIIPKLLKKENDSIRKKRQMKEE